MPPRGEGIAQNNTNPPGVLMHFLLISPVVGRDMFGSRPAGGISSRGKNVDSSGDNERRSATSQSFSN